MKIKKYLITYAFFLVSIFLLWTTQADAIPIYNRSDWLDNQTNVIPEKYAFTPRFTSESKVIDSRGVDMSKYHGYYTSARPYTNSTSGKYVTVSNVGFYEGHSVTVKYEFGTNLTYTTSYDAIYADSASQFLSVVTGGNSGVRANGKYSFYDESGKPLAISGHLAIMDIDEWETFTLQSTGLKNFYSVPKTFYMPGSSWNSGSVLDVSYASSTTLDINGYRPPGTGHVTSAARSFVATFDNQQSISVGVRHTPENKGIGVMMRTGYGEVTPAIALTAPVGRSNRYDTIDSSNYDDLRVRFTQELPHQPVNTRYETATWKLTNPLESDAYEIEWEVRSNKRGDITNQFTFGKDGSIVTNNFLDNMFYDVELEFIGRVKFNGKPIDVNELNNNGELLLTSKPELTVSNGPFNDKKKIVIGEEYSTFDTTINMNSKVSRTFSTSGGEIRPKEEFNSYITHIVPPADYFDDYAYVKSTPYDMNHYKIRYSIENEQRIYESGWPFIPEHTKWLNSLDRTVSSKYSFVMAFNEKTKLKEKSDGILVDKMTTDKHVPFDSSKDQYVIFENAGYWNFEPVTVRVDIKPSVKAGISDNNYIVFEGEDFLSVSSDKNNKSVELKYSFFDSKGQPLKVSGLLPVAGVSGSDRLTFDRESVKEIGSVTKEYQNNKGTTIRFNQKESEAPDLHIIGTEPRDINSARQSMAILYEEQSSFSLTMRQEASPITNDFQFNLKYLKELPIIDTSIPKGVEKRYEEITEDISKELGVSFIQYIPYRTPEHSLKEAVWSLDRERNSSIFDTSTWQVKTLTGKDVTSSFVVNSDGSISLKDSNQSIISNEVLIFTNLHKFNGDIVNNSEVDSNKYLNLTGNILGHVESKTKNSKVAYKTSINMDAELTVLYKEENSKEVIQPSTREKLLITQPLPKAPSIDGYSFKLSDPEEFTHMKYSKDEIIYLYKMELAASQKQGTIILGQKEEDIDFSKFVKDVKTGSKELSSDEYRVELSEKSVLPDIVISKESPKTIFVDVILVSNPAIKITVESKVDVVWGNSIAFGGEQGSDGRMGGGAYTLNKGKLNPYITAVSGAVTSDDNNAISMSHPEEYLDFGIFPLKRQANPHIFTPSSRPTGSRLTAKGIETKQSLLNKWNSAENRVQEVAYGDVVRGWSTEAEKQYLTNDTIKNPTPLNNKQNEVYYEVTETGYRRLQFNRIEKVEEQLILYGTSDTELNKKAINGEFIKLKDLEQDEDRQAKIIGFKEGHYPETSKPNVTVDSIIVIEEKLLTNNEIIHYEVPVKFTILDGGLSFKSADDLSFGIQNLPSSDVYFTPIDKENSVVVEDTRYSREKWNLNASLEKTLQYVEGTTPKELVGSSIIMLGAKDEEDKVLNKEGVVVHEVSDEEAKNDKVTTITWNNRTNEGYRLFVKNGTAEKDKKYRSTITYSIDDKPKPKAAGQ